MKQKFWKTDWFAGLAISVAFLAFSGTPLLQGLEQAVYDFSVRASERDPGDRIAVIGIDDESLSNLGRWPWPRTILAEMVDRLAEAKAKVIGLTILLSEPQIDPGLQAIRELHQYFEQAGLDQRQDPPELAELGRRLAATEASLDTDGKLAQSMEKAGNVILGMQFTIGEPLGNPDQPLPGYVTRNALTNIDDRIGAAEQGLYPLPTLSATPPVPRLGEKAMAIGHLVPGINEQLEVDARLEPLVLRYYDSFYPSLALQIAARSLNLTEKDIKVNLGEGVELGRLKITTDPDLMMHTFYYSDREGVPAFPIDSFFDVYSGKIPVEKYRDKIVLIGATAFGLGSTLATPLSSATEPARILAHTVASILNEDFFIVPSWASMAETAVFLLVALYLILALPRLKAGMAAAISALLLLALLGSEIGLMVGEATWVRLVTAATLLVVGHLLLTTKRFLVTEAGKLRSETESAESNKMLGLAFQQQGQLDMAFEKFRKAPLSEEMMDPLYNLALDYERKRQFNKAMAVYQYMSEFDPDFRDIKTRMNRARQLEETVMLGGGGGGGTAGATLLLDGGDVEKPKLGRYEVEKELGKGAMGVVYLGKDPTINRIVAIKTMALAQEFEEDELEEVKSRFFREAETAGRLTHPNIVTIYDAGEEHDLAYIAMEFLEGHDLVRYTKPDNLLPIPMVIGIIYKAAEALDFAHKQNVVHRDIKPANIMYLPKKKDIKITDFGIARITDSSKTKTGMVLGTPSYMSPEQLAGKKVDGRSDLFSLGVMLYQLLTGELPFKGESMATLMYKIANEPPTPIAELRPELVEKAPCLLKIIEKALEKDREKRYQTGAEMARDLKACAKMIAGKVKK